MVQARRKKTTASRQFNILPYVRRALQEAGFLAFIGAALYLSLALVSFGVEDPAWTHTGHVTEVANLGGALGARIADIMLYFFGYLAFLFPLSLALWGWMLFRRDAWLALDAEIVIFRILGFLVVLAAGCGLASLHLESVPGYLTASAGGILGSVTGPALIAGFGFVAGKLFLLTLFLASLSLATGVSWLEMLDFLGNTSLRLLAALSRLLAWLRDWLAPGPAPLAGEAAAAGEAQEHAAERLFAEPSGQSAAPPSKAPGRIEPVLGLAVENDAPSEEFPPFVPPPPVIKADRKMVSAPRVEPRPPALVASRSVAALPPLELLNPVLPRQRGYSAEVLESMSRHLEILLRHYGIEVKVVAVEPGPVITCFELEPAPGIKVSQISSLAKDLARGLSVSSVRVVEVIPGKSVVGLEIPNQQREIVHLSEILTAPVYANATAPTTLALGKDIAGNPVVANLAKMPHLLVAGTTGSGKSVAINAMLLSLLYKARSEEVRLILVDPKMLELSVYEGIPQLLTPVVTDMKEAANALRWCVAEMERRYRLMAALQVRNLAGFNRKLSDTAAAGQTIADPLYKPEFPESAGPPALEPLPVIVVVIDELADMMMIVGKKVEELIARLAQKARASGIHLILATQRPSVDVITGLIKANIPTRIAFQVSSKVDSRTILDQMGAEQLLGHGDMLYLPPGMGFPRRLHGAFVDDQEVHRVVEFLRQSGEPDYVEGILEGAQDAGGSFADPDDSQGAAETDPLYDEAVRIVTETRRASTSAVQRRLKIGYNRAARMIEEMESAGIVGPLQSNGLREVLAPPPPEC